MLVNFAHGANLALDGFLIHKDLVLIPDPKQTTVPTHSARVLLESKGYVLHSFPFDRDWDGIEKLHNNPGI